MATKRLRSVTGTYAVTKATPVTHEEGFRYALDNALRKTRWPAGKHVNVRIEYSATIRVVNPGNIIEYAATLVPPG